MSMREHRRRLKERKKVSTSFTIEEKEVTPPKKREWTLEEVKERWSDWKLLKRKNPNRQLPIGVRGFLRSNSYVDLPPNEEVIATWDIPGDEKVYISVGITKGGSYYIATRKLYLPTLGLSEEELDRITWKCKRVIYFSEHNYLEWMEGINILKDVYDKGEEIEKRDLVLCYMYMGKLTETGDYKFRYDFKIILWRGSILYCIDKTMRNYNPKKANYVPCNSGFKFARSSAGNYFNGWNLAFQVLLDKLTLRTQRRLADARETPDTLELYVASDKLLEDELIDGN